MTTASSRSQTFAAPYLPSYAPVSIPSLVAGVLASRWGLEDTGHAYAAFVAVLSLTSLVPRIRPAGVTDW